VGELYKFDSTTWETWVQSKSGVGNVRRMSRSLTDIFLSRTMMEPWPSTILAIRAMGNQCALRNHSWYSVHGHKERTVYNFGCD